MSKKVKIFSIVTIVIAILIWVMSSMGGKEAAPVATPTNRGGSLTTSAGVRPATSAVSDDTSTNDFSTLLSSINSIDIDTSIFNNPAYRTLRDYPVSLGSDTVGRINPFAPVGTDQSTGASGMTEVETLQPGKITSTSAEFGAQVTLTDTVPVSVVFNYGTTDAFGSATAPITLNKTGTALVTVTGLTPATQYIVKAIVVRGSITTEGDNVPFATSATAPRR
jgi:hypothetical protein